VWLYGPLAFDGNPSTNLFLFPSGRAGQDKGVRLNCHLLRRSGSGQDRHQQHSPAHKNHSANDGEWNPLPNPSNRGLQCVPAEREMRTSIANQTGGSGAAAGLLSRWVNRIVLVMSEPKLIIAYTWRKISMQSYNEPLKTKEFEPEF